LCGCPDEKKIGTQEDIGRQDAGILAAQTLTDMLAALTLTDMLAALTPRDKTVAHTTLASWQR
jgi:hypothetical protein